MELPIEGLRASTLSSDTIQTLQISAMRSPDATWEALKTANITKEVVVKLARELALESSMTRERLKFSNCLSNLARCADARDCVLEGLVEGLGDGFETLLRSKEDQLALHVSVLGLLCRSQSYTLSTGDVIDFVDVDLGSEDVSRLSFAVRLVSSLIHTPNCEVELLENGCRILHGLCRPESYFSEGEEVPVESFCERMRGLASFLCGRDGQTVFAAICDGVGGRAKRVSGAAMRECAEFLVDVWRYSGGSMAERYRQHVGVATGVLEGFVYPCVRVEVDGGTERALLEVAALLGYHQPSLSGDLRVILNSCKIRPMAIGAWIAAASNANVLDPEIAPSRPKSRLLQSSPIPHETLTATLIEAAKRYLLSHTPSALAAVADAVADGKNLQRIAWVPLDHAAATVWIAADILKATATEAVLNEEDDKDEEDASFLEEEEEEERPPEKDILRGGDAEERSPPKKYEEGPPPKDMLRGGESEERSPPKKNPPKKQQPFLPSSSSSSLLGSLPPVRGAGSGRSGRATREALEQMDLGPHDQVHRRQTAQQKYRARELERKAEEARRMTDGSSKKSKKRSKSKAKQDTPQTIEQEEEDVPEEFRCAIDGHVMQQPVRGWAGGPVFEKAAIEAWIRQYGEICPSTGRKLTLRDLTPDDTLATQITNWTTRRALRKF